LFFDDIQNNDYYVFVSSIASNALERISAVNSQYSKNKFLENVLFGKKIFNSDVKFMIKYHPWQKDQVYVQYDDKENLEDKRFYAVVGPNNNDSGDYRVFKCLSNNNGGASTTPPNFNPVTVNQIYRTADGYVWKYMYVITVPEFEAYNAVGFVPLIGNFEIDPTVNSSNSAFGSEISDIFVENFIDNAGYPFVDNGVLSGPPGNDGTLNLRSPLLSQIANYYSGMVIYVNNTTGESFVYEIDTYTYNTTTGLGQAKVKGDPRGDGVALNAGFQILPRIEIKGDGTGAVAIPRIVAGRIQSILVLNSGSGYFNITARVVDPLYDFDPDDPFSIDVRATLRPLLSPQGGHNYNLIDEMYCRHILLYGYITETDNNQIGASNSYSVIGIVKNPEFTADLETANTDAPDVFDNRIAITTDDYPKAVINSILTQLDVDNNVTFSAKVHAVDETSNTVYLSEYMGPYVNTSNNDISLNPSIVLRNETGQLIEINSPAANNVIESRYTQRTGTVYFFEDFFPLTRDKTSREEYKLVLEF
jgi:hypothetical protein